MNRLFPLYLCLLWLFSSISLFGSVPKEQLGNSQPAILRLKTEYKAGDDSVELNGTGTIFRKTSQGNEIRFCILTADHVVCKDGKLTLGFGDVGASGSFSVEPKAMTKHGSENFTDADLAVLQITIDKSQVSDTQWNFLNAISPFPIGPPPNADREWQFDQKLMYNVSLWGYGRTGDPLRQDGYRSLFARAEHDPGKLRWFNQRIIAHVNNFEFKEDSCDKTYRSNIMLFTFDRNRDAGAIAGEGYGLQGDSGGPVFAGKFLVGVQTFASSEEVKNEKGEVIGIDVLYGKGGAPIRLTPAYLRRINEICPDPEPYQTEPMNAMLLETSQDFLRESSNKKTDVCVGFVKHASECSFTWDPLRFPPGEMEKETYNGAGEWLMYHAQIPPRRIRNSTKRNPLQYTKRMVK